jgi:hypothetical protein
MVPSALADHETEIYPATENGGVVESLFGAQAQNLT